MGNVVTRPKLSYENLIYLKRSTKFDEKTIIEIFEEFRNLNPSGRMNLVKLLKIYKDFFPEKNCENICRHVFRVLDIDQNGFVDFKEFLISLDTLVWGTLEEKMNVS